MKILMLIKGLNKGGKERRMLELIKGLTGEKNRFEIYLVSLSSLVEFDYVYDLPIKFEIIEKKSNKDVSLLLRLRKILKNFKPDIIHSWDVTATGYITLVNFFPRKPLINCVIADAYSGLNIFDPYYLRVKLFTSFSDVIVSNSLAGIKAYRVPDKKAACVYNGVDFNRFDNLKPALQVEADIFGSAKGSRYVAVMVAAFEKRKDYVTLIQAALELCSKDLNIVFLLIGDGSELLRIKTMVPSYLLDKQIFFLGKRSDIESILQIADVGLLISPCEGISNSIIEYMASGKPVIASEGGGTNELVVEGVNGFLVEQKQPSQIIERVLQLKDDKKLSLDMGNNAFRWVREKFGLSTMTARYVELYDKYSK